MDIDCDLSTEVERILNAPYVVNLQVRDSDVGSKPMPGKRYVVGRSLIKHLDVQKLYRIIDGISPHKVQHWGSARCDSRLLCRAVLASLQSSPLTLAVIQKLGNDLSSSSGKKSF